MLLKHPAITHLHEVPCRDGLAYVGVVVLVLKGRGHHAHVQPLADASQLLPYTVCRLQAASTGTHPTQSVVLHPTASLRHPSTADKHTPICARTFCCCTNPYGQYAGRYAGETGELKLVPASVAAQYKASELASSGRPRRVPCTNRKLQHKHAMNT